MRRKMSASCTLRLMLPHAPDDAGREGDALIRTAVRENIERYIASKVSKHIGIEKIHFTVHLNRGAIEGEEVAVTATLIRSVTLWNPAGDPDTHLKTKEKSEKAAHQETVMITELRPIMEVFAASGLPAMKFSTSLHEG